MIKRLVLPSLLLGLVAAGGWAGWQWWTQWRFAEGTDNAYVHSDVTPISPKVAGHVVAVEIADNQQVAAGQVLLRIDDRDYRARLEQARAAVAGAKAALANIDTRLTVQNSVIAGAEAQLEAAAAEAVRARQELTRAQRLVRDDYASRQRLDADQAAVAKAAAAERAAAAARDAAIGQIEVLRAERAVAEAGLWRAEAALAAAEVDLEGTVVRAPVDGVVGNRGVRVGQFVRPGAVLMAVVPLHGVWIEANFKETQIGRLAAGQAVSVAIDAFPGWPVTGRIDSFAPASGAQFSLLPPENASGNFTKVVQRIPVRIALPRDNPLAGLLRPGMSAVVSVDTRDVPAGGAVATR